MTDSEILKLLLNKVNNIEENVVDVKKDVTNIKDNVVKLESKVVNLENKVTNIEKNVKSIELTIENEVRTNIKRIAEGHLDLSRNLHEALKKDNEKEMLSIRVNILETEVHKIKEQLN